jgi:hypothetical protein
MFALTLQPTTCSVASAPLRLSQALTPSGGSCEVTWRVQYEIVNPDAAGTIASLRSLGYSVAAAVADLVDNSVSAGAKSIEVVFSWSGRNSWVAVIDDGRGMSESGLRIAMTVAGTSVMSERAANDLGRFGMGLKTASFSQASELVVRTAEGHSAWSTRSWDLDVVRDCGEWRLLLGADESANTILETLLDGRARGTAVLWRRLHRFDGLDVDEGDELAQKQFYDEVRAVESLLGMVFGRFLTGRGARRVTVNGARVAAWDPFLSDQPATQRLPVEELPVGDHVVRVEPHVLPHRSRFADDATHAEAGGPGGWMDQQGFYVYRRDRLLVAGDWLGLRGLRREDRYALARIAVHVPAELDTDWAVDVRKASVVPPVAVRAALRRIGLATQRAAREVVTRRGRVSARTHGAAFVFPWRMEQRSGRAVCRINRQHPLVAQVLRGGLDAVADARALIRLLEETVPVTTLRVLHDSDTVADPEPFDGVATDEAVEVARRIVASLVEQGSSPREARLRLRQMEPFDRLDGFWHH